MARVCLRDALMKGKREGEEERRRGRARGAGRGSINVDLFLYRRFSYQLLNEQYRMPPAIGGFISNSFYSGMKERGENEERQGEGRGEKRW